MQLEVIGPLIEAYGPAHAADDGPLWRAWSLDPQVVLPIALAGFFYARGLRRWTDRSRAHPWWRTVLYFSGLALLLLAIESPLDRLGEHHFSMHMVQHEVTMMLAVPLILLGAPTTPSLRGLPRFVRIDIVRPLAKRPEVRALYRGVTHPVFAIFVFNLALWWWHLAPGWYDAALTSSLAHDAQHVTFIAVAVLLWWNVIDPKPLRSRLAYLPRVLYVFAAGAPKHILGAMITFAEEPLYDAYQTATPILSLSVTDDQALAGLIMWVPSLMMVLAIMGAIFAVWAQRSEAHQRELDAALASAR
jgi:cytochrome c oxidase assembly factor CtaG